MRGSPWNGSPAWILWSVLEAYFELRFGNALHPAVKLASVSHYALRLVKQIRVASPPPLHHESARPVVHEHVRRLPVRPELELDEEELAELRR